MKCNFCKKTLLKVGVAIRAVVIQDGTILLGQRKNTGHQDGRWEVPGGHYEYGEEFINAAIRELKEETGLVAKPENCNIVGITNDYLAEEEKHYVSIYVQCDEVEGVPKIMEPDKCAAWAWFPLNDLPSPLTQSLKNFIKSRKEGEK